MSVPLTMPTRPEPAAVAGEDGTTPERNVTTATRGPMLHWDCLAATEQSGGRAEREVGSVSGTNDIREEGRPSFSERVAAGGQGETRGQAISPAGETATVDVPSAGGAAHPLPRGAGEANAPSPAMSHPGAGVPAPGPQLGQGRCPMSLLAPFIRRRS